MIKAYCQDCGAEIKNVEDWLLAATPKLWKCRACFYSVTTDVQSLETENTPELFVEAA